MHAPVLHPPFTHRHARSGVGFWPCPLGDSRPSLPPPSRSPPLALAAPTTATARGGHDRARGHGHGHGHHAKEVRFATFNASLNRTAAGQLVTDLSTPDNAQAQDGRRDHPAQPARRAAGQRVRLRRGRRGRRAVPRQLPRGLAERRPPGRTTPTTSCAESNTGIPSGFDLNNNGTVGGGDDAFGFGAYPGQFGHGGLLEVPHRLPAHPDLPALPLEGHAGRDAARRPGHARAGRLVLARGARRLPAVQQVPLGPADPDRPQDRALPGLAPDAAGVRRRRGPQRHPQLRRDPVLGRLRARRQEGGVHLRRRGPVRRAALTARSS